MKRLIPAAQESVLGAKRVSTDQSRTETRLVRIKSAGHIPMENDPKAVAGALAEFLLPNADGGYR